jgi:hypothetical protein
LTFTSATTGSISGANVSSTKLAFNPSTGALTPTSLTPTNPLAEAYGGTGTTTGYYGFKNRIINGAMVIDQRNSGSSVTITNTGAFTYTLDRWAAIGSQASKFSVQQNAGSVTPPVGFKNYLGVTSLSAYSVGASESFRVIQCVEGFNTADLAWGTANAKTVTLSFQVYSSLTGTFGGSVRNQNNDRYYPFSYTISSANTWTSISITIAGDTTGTWETTNGTGIQIQWSLGSGSTVSGTAGVWGSTVYTSVTGATSVVGTNGATFYITGVQLEKGSTATSFDYRPYGTELILCERYYDTSNNTLEIITPAGPFTMRFATIMRATPTLSTSQNTGSISDVSVQKGSFRAQSTAIAVLSYTASAEL